ncbi:MAG: KpsF/GutQ family sugar-phosphate isomerase [Planctomycetota bacterium]|nr:KpsF/GutQ family sugar-phosphate isomerase [Planctomycetota bacterium]
MSDDIEYGREILSLEAEAIRGLRDILDERFAEAVQVIHDCKGQIVLTGMGKSGIIARKISATLASTGTRSIYLHPAEAIHGDLGRVTGDDVVIALSRSGESEEVRRLVPAVKQIGALIIALTSQENSTLAQHADCLLPLGQAPEACPLRLAPTTSTTAQLALGDALAMCVAKRRGFSREKYALYHPGGSLGRALLRVRDLMSGEEHWPAAPSGTTTRTALETSGGTGRRPGALAVVDGNGLLRGIFTDGDLRRHTLKDVAFLDLPIDEVMTADPKRVRDDQLAAEAWLVMKSDGLDELPVVDKDGRYIGLLDVQDLLAAGIAEK